ncbi:uncharacterized protein PAN0_017d5476 [Moesziomyces antarcticus]|uniref:Uncharacterized protein n=2 Tax=Pseudozyma antarctica TaxID=84753 RepID=A0A081CKQ3_PSEA2|nr:uncharacterized protein PAN0_017d5476 [Moesziomyces antarcticus]GAK67249.1 conserved hypothetical protein [Moesziomyces antarcticus]SPO48140.1 uncharacterized protein PSANT_05828 [Moesziomyces antarcticus]
MVELLPPPMELVLGPSTTDALPQCTPNLMPFHIDYDGPAPVDSFLLLRAAASDDSQDQSSSSTTESAGSLNSYVSAFRGRAIQSTSLPLPPGYRAELVRIAQVEPPASAQPSTSTAAQPAAEDDKERQRKRQKTTRMPAKQQRFSMDSDDDDNEDEEQSDRDASPASEREPEQQEETQPTVARTDERAAARVRIAPAAHVADDELRIWGPDGPVDRGDDTLFRTVGEWMTTVAPIPAPRFNHIIFTEHNFETEWVQGGKCLPGQGNGRVARATKRYRAQRSALERISKGSIRRLARRGGVKRKLHPPGDIEAVA